MPSDTDVNMDSTDDGATPKRCRVSQGSEEDRAHDSMHLFTDVLASFPGDLESSVLRFLDSGSLLRVRETSRHGARAAGANEVWGPLMNGLWKGHDVSTASIQHSSERVCMNMYRAMHVPPAPLALNSGTDYTRPPLPPPATTREILRSPGLIETAIGEYRLFVEISCTKTGAKLLSQVVCPFSGLLGYVDPYDLLENPDSSGRAAIEVEPDAVEPFPTPPLEHRREWKLGLPSKWGAEVFGPADTEESHIIGRLCIEHRGNIVALDPQGGDLQFFSSEDSRNDAAVILFPFHLPALSLPEDLVSELRRDRIFFEEVSANLHVRLHRKSVDSLEWAVSHFCFEMDPCASYILPEERREMTAYEMWTYSNDVGDRGNTTDATLLCCLSEAIAATRREVSDYYHPSHFATQLDRKLLVAVVDRQWEEMRRLRSIGANCTAAIQKGDYPVHEDGHSPCVGMMPLHFAIRDHAPLHIIREICEAFLLALYLPEGCGLTPVDFLDTETTNPHHCYSSEAYEEVEEYLQGLPAYCS